ncbi:hypothetical protein V6N11_019193 [Hibiscus sabdariffa]|uniref:CCHC-type domain-containing protein n=1 Tax=Hibiscus sabdariffa TaxID=183260 RepID=A0ABR2R2G2_9ROSI
MPSADSRLPKKQWRRDEAPPDNPASGDVNDNSGMDCDNQESKVPSYKDMLTGNSENIEDDDLISLGDEDIDLLDDDIQTGESDGIPYINFSDCIKDLAIKSMDFTLVLKILGRRVGYSTLFNRVMGLWKPTHQIKLIYIFTPRFEINFDRHTRKCPTTSIVGLKINLHNLANPCSKTIRVASWLGSVSPAIGARIGKVVKIDFQTDYGRRGTFARMAVKINLKTPLVSKIAINGQIQFVEYESLPTVCFKCGVYGHVSDNCATANVSLQAQGNHASSQP